METDDVDEPFVEEEWIGKGTPRKYDWAKLPAFVTSSRREIRLQKRSEGTHHTGSLVPLEKV
jgi:hypothetical protein